MSQLSFDEREAAQLEAVYRTGDAERRRRIVLEALAPSAGERILDVGCGPGFYCLELAGLVGPSGSIVGVDSSQAMLELASRRCAGRQHVELREADASSLPIADAEFDGALCVQVLEYLADPTVALAELARALRPGGRVVVWDIDWATLSIYSAEPDRTARVLRAWDEHLAHRSLPRTLAPRLRSAGFEDVRVAAHPLLTVEFDPTSSYGPAIAPFIAAFVKGRSGISADEAAAWVDEQRTLGARGEYYFFLTQFCFTATKRP